MNLIQRIHLLPQVLQDLIAEYNVEHRPKMFFVLREILILYDHSLRMKYVFMDLYTQVRYKGWKECVSCSDLVDPEHEYVFYIMGERNVCCSDWCKYDAEWSARKQWKAAIRNAAIRNAEINTGPDNEKSGV